MTTWLCVSPSTTILTYLTILPLLFVFYCLMDKRQTTKHVSKTTVHGNIPYYALNSGQEDGNGYLTWLEKVKTIRENALLFMSIYIGHAGGYLIVQSIVTTLLFPNAPFDPRDHYQYYTFLFMAGEFIGRSYGFFLSLMNCKITGETEHTWVFTIIILANALFLIFASWYHFLHSVYIVLAAVFCIGLNGGALYCNTYMAASRDSSSRHIEFSRSFLTMGSPLGVVTAAFVGMYVEPLLKEHCQRTFLATDYCLTRSRHAWNTSVSC